MEETCDKNLHEIMDHTRHAVIRLNLDKCIIRT